MVTTLPIRSASRRVLVPEVVPPDARELRSGEEPPVVTDYLPRSPGTLGLLVDVYG